MVQLLDAEWQARAACRGRARLLDQPPEWRTPAALDTALSICRGCPVQQECAAWALTLWPHQDPHWVIGGLTPEDRTRRRGGHKRCRRCHQVKPMTGFYRDRRAHDGRQAECKPCQDAGRLARYHARRRT